MAAGQAIPYSQNFSSATFPPTAWSINNPDGSTTWDRATASQGGGSGSLWMDNFNYQASGAIDEMVMPNFDLTTINNPQLTFYLAYQLYTDPASNPNYSDTLEILISTDCGATYSSLYKKSGISLTTTTPTWANNSFTPTATQWRKEIINLTSYSSATSAIFKARNINDYENNLYVDNINIESSTGIGENLLNDAITVYPNPASDWIKLDADNLSVRSLIITIQDVLGNAVLKKNYTSVTNIHDLIDVSVYSSGLYFIKVEADQFMITKKLVLSR